jgi:hypothetical protein
MSFTPPNPGFSPTFLTDVTVCTFDAAANGLLDADGNAKTILLVQGSDGGSTVEWAVGDAHSTCPPYRLDQRTFEVLTRGTHERGGSISYDGIPHRLIAQAVGSTVHCSAVRA